MKQEELNQVLQRDLTHDIHKITAKIMLCKNLRRKVIVKMKSLRKLAKEKPHIRKNNAKGEIKVNMQETDRKYVFLNQKYLKKLESPDPFAAVKYTGGLC